MGKIALKIVWETSRVLKSKQFSNISNILQSSLPKSLPCSPPNVEPRSASTTASIALAWRALQAENVPRSGLLLWTHQVEAHCEVGAMTVPCYRLLACLAPRPHLPCPTKPGQARQAVLVLPCNQRNALFTRVLPSSRAHPWGIHEQLYFASNIIHQDEGCIFVSM